MLLPSIAIIFLQGCFDEQCISQGLFESGLNSSVGSLVAASSDSDPGFQQSLHSVLMAVDG